MDIVQIKGAAYYSEHKDIDSYISDAATNYTNIREGYDIDISGNFYDTPVLRVSGRGVYSLWTNSWYYTNPTTINLVNNTKRGVNINKYPLNSVVFANDPSDGQYYPYTQIETLGYCRSNEERESYQGLFEGRDLHFIYLYNDIESINYLGDYTFYNSKNFKGFARYPFNSSQKEIDIGCVGYKAFANCSGKWDEMISIGINIGEARDKAFENIDEEFSKNFETKIKINNYGNYMFENSTFTTLPFYPTILNEGTYKNCKNITELNDLPINLESIGDYCFFGCTGLTSITIPSSVTRIGKRAFMNCTNLETIIFENRNKSLTIDEEAFFGCYKVENIVINTTSDLTIENGAFAFMSSNSNNNLGLKSLELNCEGKLTLNGNCCSSCSNLTYIINTAKSSSLNIDLAIFQELTALEYVNLLTSGELNIKFTRYPNGHMPENEFNKLTHFNMATTKISGLSLDELDKFTLEDVTKMLKLLFSSSELNKLSLNNEIFELNCISPLNNITEICIYGTQNQKENELKNFSAFNNLKTVKLFDDDNRTYSIKTECFKDNNKLECIIESSINEKNYPASSTFYICDSITSIEWGAFDDVIKDREIDTIRLPFFVNSASRENSLRDIFNVIPNTATTIICSRQTNIPYRAIYNQHNIIDVYLPQDVISIGSEAFNRNHEAPIQLRVYGGNNTTNHTLSGLKELGEDVFTYGEQKEKNDIQYPYNSTIFLYGNTASVIIPSATNLIAKKAIKLNVKNLTTPLLNCSKYVDKAGSQTQLSYICQDVTKIEQLTFSQNITIFNHQNFKPFLDIINLNKLQFDGKIEYKDTANKTVQVFENGLNITNLICNGDVADYLFSNDNNHKYNIQHLILGENVINVGIKAFTGLTNALRDITILNYNNVDATTETINYHTDCFNVKDWKIDYINFAGTIADWLSKYNFASLGSNPIKFTYSFYVKKPNETESIAIYKITDEELGEENPFINVRQYTLTGNKFINEIDLTRLVKVGTSDGPLRGEVLLDIYGGSTKVASLIGNAYTNKLYKEVYSSFEKEVTVQ